MTCIRRGKGNNFVIYRKSGNGLGDLMCLVRKIVLDVVRISNFWGP